MGTSVQPQSSTDLFSDLPSQHTRGGSGDLFGDLPANPLTAMAPIPRVATDATRVGPGPLVPQGPPGVLKRVGQALEYSAQHPIQTAKGIVMAPLTGAYNVGRYIGQPIARAIEPENVNTMIASGTPEVTGKEALIGGIQAGATALAGPAAGKLTGLLTPALGELGGAIVAKTAVGAGVGAAYSPNDPAVGAIIGGGLGAASDVVRGIKKLTDYGNAVPEGLADPAVKAALTEPPEAAQDGLPFRAGTTRGLALARADEIANRAPLFSDLPTTEDAAPSSGIKFTEGRAAASMPPESRILTPADASAQPSQLITPEPSSPSQLVSPTPDAQPMAGPLYDRFGTPIEKSPTTPTGAYDARGIGRRPVAELPVNQRPPVEPPPDAETQSFGGVIGRRPGGQPVTPEPPPDIPPAIVNRLGQEPAPPVEPPPNAETASFGGEPANRLQPVASSNGTFEARPGVLRKVNAEIGPEDIGRGATPTPESRAEQPDVTGTRSFVAKEVTPGAEPIPGTPEPRPSDILNVAKLNLDKTAEQRVADQLEQFRSMRDEQKQTFAEADVNRRAIYNELTAGNPKALLPADAAKLSGEELLARRDVVNQNDQMIGNLSKAIASGEMTPVEQEAATQLMQKAIEHNDALLQDLVTGSSQKGRDLNLLRRMANTDLDPATWLVQAKRMLGNQPLTDGMMSDIRRLVQAAVEACG